MIFILSWQPLAFVHPDPKSLLTVSCSWIVCAGTGTVSGANSEGVTCPPEGQRDHAVVGMGTRGVLPDVSHR